MNGKPENAPNAMTFDLEEWFHAHALRIPRERWNEFPSRLAKPVDEILSLLDQHDTRATFFVLGWVASRDPSIVERIHDAGHEIACHGYGHEPVTDQTRAEFREDVHVAKALLEGITGDRVIGYRAPSYSVSPQTEWVYDELAALGFAYDSSLYPARAPHRGYGVPHAPLVPHRIRPNLWEFPLPTLRLFGCRVPAATGAYLRLSPLIVTRRAIAQNLRRSIPVVVNLHPWELDPAQPREATSGRVRFRQYGGLRSTARKLGRLLGAYRFGPLRDLHAQCETRGSSVAAGRRDDLEYRMNTRGDAPGPADETHGAALVSLRDSRPGRA